MPLNVIAELGVFVNVLAPAALIIFPAIVRFLLFRLKMLFALLVVILPFYSRFVFATTEQFVLPATSVINTLPKLLELLKVPFKLWLV